MAAAAGCCSTSALARFAGAYTSTDIGKITSLAMLDAYRKMANDARSRLQAGQQ